MYSAVNKKVSGWELASCNNKMHGQSAANPSVSILQLSAVRMTHMQTGVTDSTLGCVCVCVHLVLMGGHNETL